MKRTGPTNQRMKIVIGELKKLSNVENAPIWKRIAEDLEMSTRQRRVVNIHRIQRNTESNDVIVVPGKILSDGEIDHSVTVAAFSFSKKAEGKITNAGGKIISIEDLMNDSKKVSKIKIIG